jgi:hypothetical protein
MEEIELRIHLPIYLLIPMPGSNVFYEDDERTLTAATRNWLRELHRQLGRLENSTACGDPLNIVYVRVGTSKDKWPTFVYGNHDYDENGLNELEPFDSVDINDLPDRGAWVCTIQIRGEKGYTTEHFYFHDFWDRSKLQLRLLLLAQSSIK